MPSFCDAISVSVSVSVFHQERGWKLLLLLRRMLLLSLSRDKWVARFDKFAVGHWNNLFMEGNCCAQEAATASDGVGGDPTGRIVRVELLGILKLVQLGE